jgi:peroxidase
MVKIDSINSKILNRIGAIGIAVICAQSLPSATAADRSIDGSGNNIDNPTWGEAGTNFSRIAPSNYDDGISTPREAGLSNVREVSNAVSTSTGSRLSGKNLSDFTWQWGQFIDHDITLAVPSSAPADFFPITVAAPDLLAPSIPMSRTQADPASGTSLLNPREQINSISNFLDASVVYGSDPLRASTLRAGSGGRLATSAGNMMPFNTTGLPNANDLGLPESSLYLGGDVRSNEQTGLTAMQTLFVREHNRLADEIAIAEPAWIDEEIYQRARKIVGAQIQSITYNEFLPALMGSFAPDIDTLAYDPTTDATISNEFAAAMFRFGHTMVSPQLQRINNDGIPAAEGPLSLAESYFDPTTMADSTDLNQVLLGLATQKMQEIDTEIVDELQNQLFGAPGEGGLDLASLNLQRGRDHGLPSYNDIRVAFGLDPALDFSDITDDPVLAARLADGYSDVDGVDMWVGALAEDDESDSNLGELLNVALQNEFEQLVEGDRFFFLFDSELDSLQTDLMSTHLSDIIMRNTDITNIQENVFVVVPEPSVLFSMILSFGLLAIRRRRD